MTLKKTPKTLKEVHDYLNTAECPDNKIHKLHDINKEKNNIMIISRETMLKVGQEETEKKLICGSKNIIADTNIFEFTVKIKPKYASGLKDHQFFRGFNADKFETPKHIINYMKKVFREIKVSKEFIIVANSKDNIFQKHISVSSEDV
jgi:hypothetical protein